METFGNLMGIGKTIKVIALVVLSFSQISMASIPTELFLNSMKSINNDYEGLKEPSGLSLSFDNKSLWTVSDDTSSIFKINLKGDLLRTHIMKIDELDDLEGIIVGLKGKFIYTINEENNLLFKIDIINERIIDKIYLKNLIGYEDMVIKNQYHFNSDFGKYKGLEGISINPKNGNFLLLKESGLLIEISNNLKKIIKSTELNFALDYSGIAFENIELNRVWILSDDSENIHLYDIKNSVLIKSFELLTLIGEKYDSAEGVAYNLNSQELYVVTDDGQKLRKYNVFY
jgi:uncharacterized protein YjiK